MKFKTGDILQHKTFKSFFIKVYLVNNEIYGVEREDGTLQFRHEIIEKYYIKMNSAKIRERLGIK